MHKNSPAFMINVIESTPIWVWIVFVYLLVVGFKATRTRIIYAPRLFIIPSILIGLKYQIFFSENYFDFIFYLSFLLIGTGLGIISAATTTVTVFKDTKTIEIPGSYSTLTILLLFFCIKYIFGYLQATNPILANQFDFLEISLDALLPGYFLGKAERWCKLLYTNQPKR